MRYLKSVFQGVCLAALAICFTHCSKDAAEDVVIGDWAESDVISASVRLSVGATSVVGSTRSLSSEETIDENSIKNLWVIQTNGTKASYFPHYIEDYNSELGETIDIGVPTSGSATFYFVANTFDASWGDWIKSTTTIADIEAYAKEVAQESDCMVGEDYNMIFCGKQIAPHTDIVDGFALTADVNRTVAKINFNIINSAKVEILGVQLKNIPATSRYFVASDEKAKYPLSPNTTIDYPQESIDEESRTENQSFEWYMPVNRRGVADSWSSDEGINVDKYKPLVVRDAYCTYVEVVLVQEYDGEQAKCTYHFYLGENLSNNFNISANYNYTYNIDVASAVADSETDHRIKHHEVIPIEPDPVEPSVAE